MDWNGRSIEFIFNALSQRRSNFRTGYNEDDRFLSCFLVLLKNRDFVGIQRYSILENGYEGVRRECLSLKLTGKNDRLVELGEFPRGSLFFGYP